MSGFDVIASLFPGRLLQNTTHTHVPDIL